jgi:predicted membrane protein DUF2306
VLRRLFFLLVLASSLATALGSLLYILGDPNQFAYPFLPKYQAHLVLVRTHGVASALTLILGPLGFVQSLGLHRQRGQLYLMCVLVGSITAVPMSLMAEGGPVSQAGFLLMSVLWAGTGYQAWREARRRNFLQHRIWVYRNFALSFGAVIFRAYLHEMQLHGQLFHVIYPSAVWVCWIPVMLVGELLIERSRIVWPKARREASEPLHDSKTAIGA